MPLPVPVVPFMKALITKNFEEALLLGLLEVSCEDFALPAMVDPSKTEMVSIVKDALLEYAKLQGLFDNPNQE